MDNLTIFYGGKYVSGFTKKIWNKNFYGSSKDVGSIIMEWTNNKGTSQTKQFLKTETKNGNSTKLLTTCLKSDKNGNDSVIREALTRNSDGKETVDIFYCYNNKVMRARGDVLDDKVQEVCREAYLGNPNIKSFVYQPTVLY